MMRDAVHVACSNGNIYIKNELNESVCLDNNNSSSLIYSIILQTTKN